MTLVKLSFVLNRQFVGIANIRSDVTRVLFLSLKFKDIIVQVLNLSLEFRIHVEMPCQSLD